MAESQQSDLEKTEPASPRRLEQAREQGQVARSIELNNFSSLVVSGGLLLFAGATLIDEQTGQPLALLEPLPERDFVLGQYTGPRGGGREWCSVSPVLLPGYDDAKPAKRERLLNDCLRHAGLLPLVEHIESRPTSWFPRVPSNVRYSRSEHLRHLPALHVRILFKQPIRGPIAIGAGRHRGLGLLACVPDSPSA